ncbi:MAG: hypothetical protein AB8B91_19595 [Rubripirellula sp.]
MNRLSLCSLVLAAFCFAFSAKANAGIVLTVESSSIAAGGSTLIDVSILSDDMLGDSIAFYDVQLEIQPLLATAGTDIVFSGAQPESFLDDPNYLFAGTSFAKAFAVDATFVDLGMPQRLSVTDSNEPLANALITGPQLLAQLQVQHQFPIGVDPSTLIGDQFRISVISASFDVESANNLIPYAGPVSFGNSGTLTVSAVPEPTSLLFLAAFLGWARLRYRRIKSRESSPMSMPA